MPNRLLASDHVAIQFGEPEPQDLNQASSLSPARTVAEEIGQRVPFRSAGQEAVVALLRTADDVRRSLNARLAPEGITLQQYNVLRILRGAGAHGLPTLEIGNRMIERQPGVTRLVDRLIAKGLVERSRSSQDRRMVVCTITPSGLETLKRLDKEVDRTDDSIGKSLSEEEIQQMTRFLDRVRADLSES